MLSRILLGILWTATGVAIIGSLVLQNHARLTCHWKWDAKDSFMRMVVFADPQMEGDAKIRRLGKRAHVDLAFNDAYMRHIYRTMMTSSWDPLARLSHLLSWPSHSQHIPRSPTHVSILGDLFSSQWIDDTEFDVRVARYRSIFPEPSLLGVTTEAGENQENIPVMINVTGNHDIGYGYDISQERIERWEHIFGKSNFITSMDIPTPTNSEGANFNNETDSREEQNVARNNRRLHLVVLNTMLLDGPSTDENLRGQTWEFLQEASTLKERNPQDKIVLLTHIPLHKEQGICVDPPDIRVHWDNTIIEQTMLTPNTTQWILNHLQPDFILNGHDHFGCDVTHTLHFGQTAWTASLTSDPSSSTLSPTPWPTHDHGKQQENYNRHHHHQTVARKVREVTQRSMMAEFSGYSGLFEIKAPSMSTPSSSKQTQELLEFHYTACGFFNDLQVWIIIVTDLVVIILWSLYGLLHLISASLLSVIPSLGQKKNKPILSTGKQKIL